MLSTLSCFCCQQQYTELYCAQCLREGVSTHKSFSTNVANQAGSAAKRASDHLEGPRGLRCWRSLRSEVAEKQRKCEQLEERLTVVNRTLRGLAKATRPSRLSLYSGGVEQQPRRLSELHRSQEEVNSRLQQARRVLVREVISVFGLTRRNSGDWEIAGFLLPSTDDFRLHPSTMINAAVMHTVHLLSLVTRYLSVALPFIPTTIPTHVGRPTMKANLPFVGTTRFRDKSTLWMASAISKGDTARSRAKHRQFLTSFGLLAHSVAYLAYTQGVTRVGIPRDSSSGSEDVIPAASVLALLDALTRSPTLGEFSHEPGGIRSSRHLLFGLDVIKVVSSILQAEEARWGVLGGEDLSEGWDMLDRDI